MNGPEEFWSHVDASQGPTSCWPWTLSKTLKRRNYGQVRWQGKVWSTHRLAYVLTFGSIPAGLTLDHTCHNPDTCVEPCPHTACCNPAHLEPVTAVENIRRRTRSTCTKGHPKTRAYGRPRGSKWRCVTCELDAQRVRRARRKAAA